MDTTISREPAERPTWRFLVQHPSHLIALGFGAGLVPAVPGTVGTLLAFPIFWTIAPRVAPFTMLAVIAGMFLLGVWVCAATGRALGRADHGGIVWDEVTAFCLVLFFTPEPLLWQVLAFVLFRIFDIFKPPPIRYYDRKLRGGFGVMFDDLLAACYTLAVLAIVKTWVGS